MIDPAELGTASRVLSVKYAERQVQRSEVFHEYSSYGLPDATLDMDYNFWVITDSDGITLLDTGYDVAARDWLGEIPVTSTPDCLALLGIEPSDVTRVITSHFHYDHIGYLGLFTEAEVVSGGAEHDYWFGKRAEGALEGEFTTEADLAVVERARDEGRLRLVRDAERVSDAIAARPVGGHCPGELLVAVRTEGRPLLLASDAAHFYEQLEHEWPFFAFTDLGEMRRALSLINELAERFAATVIPGHDARTRQRFPALTGPAGAIAVVLA
ncbi:N-acyl homoserine lactonase family protein [Pseudonocardia spinosispora]|uniref:N-acyl homoserine lactonase family protein n=1 Tax=Pseudonocardia spinosispora TaxID=103441 RepID=UPI000421A0C2|nr:N-acyl homoserine lactonase family protein [Pseudonocardia spinosispora]